MKTIFTSFLVIIASLSCLMVKAATNLPDLKPTAISAIVFKENNICQTKIIVKVKNIGTAASTVSYGELRLEGSPFITYIPSLEANEERAISFVFPVDDLDPSNWGFEADITNQVNESNEDNNLIMYFSAAHNFSSGSCYGGTGGSGTPDLTVRITSAPSTISIGSESYFVDCRVSNVGDASYNGNLRPNPQYRVWLYPSDLSPRTQDVISTGNIGFLSPGSSRTFSIPLGQGSGLDPSLEYTLKVEVDWRHEIEETDETNNEATKTIEVSSSNGRILPGPVLIPIDEDPFLEPNVNNTMTVFPSVTDGYFQISNSQNQSNESYSITITDQEGTIVYSESGTGSSSQRIDLSLYKKGVYIIKKESNKGVEVSKIIKE